MGFALFSWLLVQMRALDHRLSDQLLEIRRDMGQGFADVQKQFGEVQRQFGEVQRQFGEVQRQFGEVHSQLAEVRADIRLHHHRDH